MKKKFRRENNGCLCSRPNMGIVMTSKEMNNYCLAKVKGCDNQRTKKR